VELEAVLEKLKLDDMSYRQQVELYEMVRKVPGTSPDYQAAEFLYEELQSRLAAVEQLRKMSGLPVHEMTPHTEMVAALGDVQLWDHNGQLEIRDAETGEKLKRLHTDSTRIGRDELASFAFSLKLVSPSS
jgi:hypothetical protein